MTVIGDTPAAAEQPVVSALPLGIATQAQILDIDDAVNNTVLSGKGLGTCYLMSLTDGGADIVSAGGSATDSPWYRVGGVDPIAASLTLTEAGDVGDAAGITTQFNLVEDVLSLTNTVAGGVGNAAGITTQINLIEAALNLIFNDTITLTVAADVGDAAGITTQINICEVATNLILTGACIIPA